MALHVAEMVGLILEELQKNDKEILQFQAVKGDDGILSIETERYFMQLGVGSIDEIGDDLAAEVRRNVPDLPITRAIREKLEKENTGWMLLFFEEQKNPD